MREPLTVDKDMARRHIPDERVAVGYCIAWSLVILACHCWCFGQEGVTIYTRLAIVSLDAASSKDKLVSMPSLPDYSFTSHRSTKNG